MSAGLRYAFVDESGTISPYAGSHFFARKELQSADFVAWAVFQKYERGNDRFYNIIAPRIVVEAVLDETLW